MNFQSGSGIIMKWIENSVISLVLLACSLADVRAATKEQLSGVFVRLYNGSEIDEYTDVHLEEAESLVLDIDKDKPTALYIHGFTESVNSTSVHTVVNAYLKRNDHNVMVFDWNSVADQHYPQVVADLDSVATSLATAVSDMVHAGLCAESLQVVGHSLGAQIAGSLGRKVDFTVPRITGLDPAGPLFHVLLHHLTATDAKFVVIIHTDSGYYGHGQSTGTVDFYPNGGRRVQPGCPHLFLPLSKEDFCSHHRSWRFYAESLTNENAFSAIPCSSSTLFSAGQANVSDPVIMGYATPTDAKGSYCLVTGSVEPYGRGLDGAHEA